MQALTQVDRAETYLRKLGVHQVRVRHHGNAALIEVEDRDFPLLRSKESEINAYLNSLGFVEVVLDPSGYRTGNVNPLTAQI